MARITPSYNLEIIRPYLMPFWHPTKNTNNPKKLAPCSSEICWWIDSVCGHEWDASVHQMVQSHRAQQRKGYKGSGCPYCHGKRVCLENCLGTNNPDLIVFWDQNLNGTLTPYDVVPGSHKSVWWICNYGHSFFFPVKNMVKNGCPKCNPRVSLVELFLFSEIKYLFPDSEHSVRINNREIDVYIKSIKIGIEYDGWFWHKEKFEKDLNKIEFFKKIGIKIIKIREGLEKISPDDVICPKNKKFSFDTMKEIILTILKNGCCDDVASNRLKCYLEKGIFVNEKFYESILDQAKKSIVENNINETHKIYAADWDHRTNGRLRPEMFTAGSEHIVNWVCYYGHLERKGIYYRIKNSGCVKCKKRPNFMLTNPEEAKDWAKNGNGEKLPEMFTSGSDFEAIWECFRGHIEKRSIYRRVRAKGCVQCKNV